MGFIEAIIGDDNAAEQTFQLGVVEGRDGHAAGIIFDDVEIWAACWSKLIVASPPVRTTRLVRLSTASPCASDQRWWAALVLGWVLPTRNRPPWLVGSARKGPPRCLSASGRYAASASLIGLRSRHAGSFG